ncbi:TetR/AcrR family transcriptional regulator [Variovorax sp.]|jgi:AcrR family transcriptional regulator|uniref:TetR/AcrR family transcriptional regulator n=1 Tax=Variovorax sp. TaxID=1871043 RepID=UPI0011FF7162|nr:TetR/AcrR family transcriptional regulator [Variovorax sp.]TAJ58977.1 MAG: TetR/AcrR family transcriptional regulator [Variovorax sp.]
MTVRSRPGGRTARTKEAALEAATALMAERKGEAITMAEVAERAGVAPTSLYRRWPDVRALIAEAAVGQLMREQPMPDTGSLRGDLCAWARAAAQQIASGESVLFQALAANAASAGAGRKASGAEPLQPRGRQIAAMLERARERAEAAPPVADVLDHVLAPLYMRALFGAPADADYAEKLVDRLLG